LDWKTYWENWAIENQGNILKQVGRTVDNQVLSNEKIHRIVADILAKLAVEKTDKILDVCCGNGILTQALATHCAVIVGVDVAESQIETAQRQYKAHNIQYLAADAQAIDTLFPTQYFDKINLYFSFQYFDTYSKGLEIIHKMAELLSEKGKILLGDVPDADKKHIFYPTLRSRIQLLYQNATHTNAMGKFWNAYELQLIAKELNLDIRKTEQASDLPYSHYRCDYLIEKKKM
jgi:ubiquinone/menaquinone biosynthesis C-methylase UbiE